MPFVYFIKICRYEISLEFVAEKNASELTCSSSGASSDNDDGTRMIEAAALPTYSTTTMPQLGNSDYMRSPTAAASSGAEDMSDGCMTDQCITDVTNDRDDFNNDPFIPSPSLPQDEQWQQEEWMAAVAVVEEGQRVLEAAAEVRQFCHSISQIDLSCYEDGDAANEEVHLEHTDTVQYSE